MERAVRVLHITADRPTTPVFHGASLWSYIEAFARAAGRSLSEWRRRIRQRNKLTTLDELELRDILLNKSDIKVNVYK
jgi:uncharacterized protein YjiS (DUF1127 family)